MNTFYDALNTIEDGRLAYQKQAQALLPWYEKQWEVVSFDRNTLINEMVAEVIEKLRVRWYFATKEEAEAKELTVPGADLAPYFLTSGEEIEMESRIGEYCKRLLNTGMVNIGCP